MTGGPQGRPISAFELAVRQTADMADMIEITETRIPKRRSAKARGKDRRVIGPAQPTPTDGGALLSHSEYQCL